MLPTKNQSVFVRRNVERSRDEHLRTIGRRQPRRNLGFFFCLRTVSERLPYWPCVRVPLLRTRHKHALAYSWSAHVSPSAPFLPPPRPPHPRACAVPGPRQGDSPMEGRASLLSECCVGDRLVSPGDGNHVSPHRSRENRFTWLTSLKDEKPLLFTATTTATIASSSSSSSSGIRYIAILFTNLTLNTVLKKETRHIKMNTCNNKTYVEQHTISKPKCTNITLQ